MLDSGASVYISEESKALGTGYLGKQAQLGWPSFDDLADAPSRAPRHEACGAGKDLSPHNERAQT